MRGKRRAEKQTVNIHEYQAKTIFKKYGIPVASGRLARTPDEAYQAAKEIFTPGEIIATKAQVHAGARGKGGGIKIAKTPDDVKAFAQKILGTNLVTPQTGPEGKPVSSLWLESSLGFKKEFYVGVVLDRATCSGCVIASTEGGIRIKSYSFPSSRSSTKHPRTWGPAARQWFRIAGS